MARRLSCNPTGGRRPRWVDDLGKKIDQSDGSGALNAQLCVLIAQQRRERGVAATPRGWDVGTLSTADFGTNHLSTFRYHLLVPPPAIFVPRLIYTVKVALAWDSKLTSNAAGVKTSILTIDLDQIILNRQVVQVVQSASYDNSYEIAEFNGVAGETYEIIIRRWCGTDDVWFGLAWNVTSKLFFQPPFIPGLE